jgi:hypothetical protein
VQETNLFQSTVPESQQKGCPIISSLPCKSRKVFIILDRNTEDKKSKQVFMTSLRSRPMPGILAGCEKNYKSRQSKLQAKSYHLGMSPRKTHHSLWSSVVVCRRACVFYLYFFNTLPDSALVFFLDLEDPVSPPSY